MHRLHSVPPAASPSPHIHALPCHNDIPYTTMSKAENSSHFSLVCTLSPQAAHAARLEARVAAIRALVGQVLTAQRLVQATQLAEKQLQAKVGVLVWRGCRL